MSGEDAGVAGRDDLKLSEQQKLCLAAIELREFAPSDVAKASGANIHTAREWVKTQAANKLISPTGERKKAARGEGEVVYRLAQGARSRIHDDARRLWLQLGRIRYAGKLGGADP